MATRRSYSGNAVATTLDTAIGTGDTTVELVDATGWPTGANGPFFFVVDRGLSTEEKATATGRTGTTLTGVTRGQDDTSASAHTAGAAVEHVFTKTDADEHNEHTADEEADPHAGTLLNNTRHDIEARHTFGAGLGTPVAPADIHQTTAAAGTGNNPSREDHVHAQPAATPRGVLGYAEVTANQTGITSSAGVDLTGLSVTVTVGTSRRIEVIGGGQVGVAGGAADAVGYIKEGATILGRWFKADYLNADGESTSIWKAIIIAPSAGSHTYKLTLAHTAGAGSVQLEAAADNPAYIVVKDIGAA